MHEREASGVCEGVSGREREGLRRREREAVEIIWGG